MAPGSPPAKRHKSNYLDTFEVLVGAPPNEQRFCVYTELLCQRSKFFEARMSARWRTSGDPKKAVELADDDPGIFTAYLDCVHGRKSSLKFQDRSSGRGAHGLDLTRLYVLADKLQDAKSMNLVIDDLIRRSDDAERVPGCEAIKYAYANSVAGSPLRRLMVDYYVHERINDLHLEEVQGLEEFLYEATVEFRSLHHAIKPQVAGKIYSAYTRSRESCHYHQHDDGHPTYTCYSDESMEDGPSSTEEEDSD